jgi:phage-related protein
MGARFVETGLAFRPAGGPSRSRATHRAVYTVRFEGLVFMLHIFQKKSTHGAATPKADIDLIRERLKVAGQMAEELTR